jgi:hypothetical protein
MARYVFFPASASGATSLAAAKKAASAHGATVVREIAGSMLLEAPPTKVAKVARALPGWQYTVETKTVRVPGRQTLSRVRLAAAKA